MRPFWHPLSAVILPEMPAYATATVTRMLLRAGRLELLYAGDRMYPTLRHGERFEAEPAEPDALGAGDVVLADVGSGLDVLRVAWLASDGRLMAIADADPGEPTPLGVQSILARIDVGRAVPTRVGVERRRIGLELREAWSGRIAPELGDAGDSVRSKYATQAPFYAGAAGAEIDQGLLRRVMQVASAGDRVLVAGSGAGKETLALADAGLQAVGIDFSEPMVHAAREEAGRRGMDVPFHCADLREHREAAGSLALVLFTYDVYSFIPLRADRTAMLREMRRWIRPDGAVLLSARRIRRAYERLILTIQWVGRGLDGAWGGSHTRYLLPDGSLCRSYVNYLSDRRLRAETREAGWRLGAFESGHAEMRPA
ncbi:MAG: class I SAM-dependent methyltransferase [bacterium]|nr:class I SAM-dependent methyltransferase [bacterium]